MILGRTENSKYEWHTVFIILPRKLIDGRWAMYHEVERINYWSSKIPASAPATFGWCYREKP